MKDQDSAANQNAVLQPYLSPLAVWVPSHGIDAYAERGAALLRMPRKRNKKIAIAKQQLQFFIDRDLLILGQVFHMRLEISDACLNFLLEGGELFLRFGAL